MKYVPRSPWFRAALVLPSLVAVVVLLWWRGPDWNLVARAFNLVDWAWIVFAIALNLVSVLVRSLAWRLTIDQALDPPHPRFDQVFSAFSIGLLANAVLPGRIGELARVAVLRRHLPHGPGTTGTLVGTVFAHRLFDLFPATLLVLYVFSTAKIPHWAVTSLMIVLVVGGLLFTLAVATAKRGRRHRRNALHQRRPGLVSGSSQKHRARIAGTRVSRAPARCADFSSWPVRDSRCFARRVRLQGRSSCKPLAGSCSCSRSTCRCARSTSTRRCRQQGSCCC